MADGHGNAVYVGDRECSVQRRHQKVIEEAPATCLSDATRAAMGEMAVKAARAVGYVGAGTVECLVDAQENFYFLEMNTRLQVEHCATEEAFAVDLVDAQLLVVSGHPLPWSQEELKADFHAIELRLYAEDPYENYRPSPGRLEVYRTPAGPGVRIDDGVEAGQEVSSLYDPMVAKLIIRGEDRAQAIRRARVALGEYEVAGIATNLPLLRHVLQCEAFLAGGYTTAILTEIPPLTRPERTQEVMDVARVLAALEQQAADQAQRPAAGGSGDGVTSQGFSTWAYDGLRRQLTRGS